MKYEFTFDYVMSKIISGETVVNCPFGCLNDTTLLSLRTSGFLLSELENKDYRGKKYFVKRLDTND